METTETTKSRESRMDSGFVGMLNSSQKAPQNLPQTMPSHPAASATTLARLAAIRSMSKAELQEQWRVLFGKEPPAYNRPFMVKRLIYRVQEIAHGGLKDETRQHMQGVMDNAGLDDLAAPKRKKKKGRLNAEALCPGTLLIREWRGKRFEVKVLSDGFEYGGARYRSLSAIAKLITGTSWNGPVFFGLKKSACAKAAR